MSSTALFAPHPELAAAGVTDRGLRRTRNEDAFEIAHEVGLCVVADGVGGGALGGAAARVAASTVRARFEALARAARGRGRSEDLWLLDAVLRANDRVHQLWPDGTTATTLVAAAFVGDAVVVAHVGDSRAYRLRGLSLERLTADHEVGGRLTRALGPEPDVDVDVRHHSLRPGDRVLLCTDGLSKMLDPARIGAHLYTHASPQGAADALVAAANAAGGFDNITAVVAHPAGGWMLRPRDGESTRPATPAAPVAWAS